MMGSAGEQRQGTDTQSRERRDRPVEEEADKDIKEGGMAQTGRARNGEKEAEKPERK